MEGSGGIFHIINSNDLPDCHKLYDGTDSVHTKRPEELVENLQKEVNNSVSWLKEKQIVCDR